MSDRLHLAGLYAVLAAAAALVLAPLLSLAYFAIPDGVGELQSATVSAWANPARHAAGPLLTFASPDRVYATYLQALALLFPAIVVSAWITRRSRPAEITRLERWGWRITLVGYSMLVVGLLAVSLLLIGVSPSGSATNAVFFPLVIPGTLLGTTGSSALGIALLRSAYRPRLTAWLLTLGLPLWLFGSVVLGHNSVGLVPLLVAWAATGRHFGRLPQFAPPVTAVNA
jgi:hypothetical protein